MELCDLHHVPQCFLVLLSTDLLDIVISYSFYTQNRIVMNIEINPGR